MQIKISQSRQFNWYVVSVVKNDTCDNYSPNIK